MREFLFRGKQLDTGKWVYGDYFKNHHGWHGIMEQTREAKCYAVDKNTVGQYIGKVDTNGIRIFEGDILKGAWGTVLRVEFDDSYLQYRAVDSHQHSREIDYYGKVRVIGNVYDSPELLEEVSGDA